MHKLVLTFVLLSVVLVVNYPSLLDGEPTYQSPLPAEYRYLSRTFYGHTRADGSYEEGHAAWDMPCPEGTELTAPCSGTIIDYGFESLAGNYIKLMDSEGRIHIFAHLKSSRPTYKLYEGKEVLLGDLLGWTGHTGRATGNHLHYQVLRRGVPINPRELLGGRWNI